MERPKWEYLAVRSDGELLSALRPLGDEGWELITILPSPDEKPGGILLLKRQKSLIEPASPSDVRRLALVPGD
jgi:hypothetical protein